MGLERSRCPGGVDGLCGLLAHTHCTRLARETYRLLRTAWIRVGDIHMAGCELHSSRVALLHWRIGVTLSIQQGATLVVTQQQHSEIYLCGASSLRLAWLTRPAFRRGQRRDYQECR